MDWKEFLRIDKRKFIILIILMVLALSPNIGYSTERYYPECATGEDCPLLTNYHLNPILYPNQFLLGYNKIFGEPNRTFLEELLNEKVGSLLLLTIGYWYVFSCGIVSIYDKLKSKN